MEYREQTSSDADSMAAQQEAGLLFLDELSQSSDQNAGWQAQSDLRPNNRAESVLPVLHLSDGQIAGMERERPAKKEARNPLFELPAREKAENPIFEHPERPENPRKRVDKIGHLRETAAEFQANQILDLLKDGEISAEDWKKIEKHIKLAYESGNLHNLEQQLDKVLSRSPEARKLGLHIKIDSSSASSDEGGNLKVVIEQKGKPSFQGVISTENLKTGDYEDLSWIHKLSDPAARNKGVNPSSEVNIKNEPPEESATNNESSKESAIKAAAKSESSEKSGKNQDNTEATDPAEKLATMLELVFRREAEAKAKQIEKMLEDGKLSEEEWKQIEKMITDAFAIGNHNRLIATLNEMLKESGSGVTVALDSSSAKKDKVVQLTIKGLPEGDAKREINIDKPSFSKGSNQNQSMGRASDRKDTEPRPEYGIDMMSRKLAR